MRRNIAICCTLIAIAFQSAVSKGTSAAPCDSPEHHQFDFWIGDWDVSDADAIKEVARVKVERILDGCALHELYMDTSGLKGESFSIYDETANLWHQTWVTNRGRVLVVEGKLQGGVIVLSGADRAPSGKRLVRAAWKPMNGRVRETAVRSTDGGKTWKPWFDLIFRPHQR